MSEEEKKEEEYQDFRENEKMVGMTYVLMSLQERENLTSMERDAINYAVTFLMNVYSEIYGGVPVVEEEGEEEKKEPRSGKDLMKEMYGKSNINEGYI